MLRAKFFRLLAKVLLIVVAAIVFAFVLFVVYVKCTGGSWSEEKRQQFADECAQTTEVDGLYFSLVGFSYAEVDTIFVRQLKNSVQVDSFFVYVYEQRSSYDSAYQRYSGHIDKPVVVEDTYHFIIPDIQTFVLSDMEMVMWAQYTMFSEGWGCVMGSYTVDSVRYEHNTNPTFVKKGYSY